MSIAAIITCIVFVLTVLLLVFQPISVIITGAAIPAILASCGIISPKTAYADFSNTTVVFVVVFCIIGEAFFKTGLADYLGGKVIGLLGKNEKGLLLGTGIVTGGLSGFLNDTGSTACMMPIVSSMAKKSGIKRSKLLLALSFFASLGGTLTLAGTTPHIVANGIMKEAGLREFTFFEYTKFGIPLLILGIIYMMFWGAKLLPNTDEGITIEGDKAEKRYKKMPICAAIFVLTIVAMASGVVPIAVAGVFGAILVVLTGCITVKEALKVTPVSTIFLVGGIFPLSSALVKTGAAKYIVGILAPYLSSLPPLLLLFAIAALQIITTQFLMNSSATVLVLPIAIMCCEAAGINPLAGAMIVSICASAAFASPFGSGNNLIVMEAGGYSIKDYVKCGLPLCVIFGIATTLLCYFFYI